MEMVPMIDGDTPHLKILDCDREIYIGSCQTYNKIPTPQDPTSSITIKINGIEKDYIYEEQVLNNGGGYFYHTYIIFCPIDAKNGDTLTITVSGSYTTTVDSVLSYILI